MSQPENKTGPYKIVQLAEKDRGKGWHWTISIEGVEAPVQDVESVTYMLDPTIADPVRTVTDPRTGFSIKGRAWNSFEVKAELILKDQRKVHVSREILLESPQGAGFSLVYENATPQAKLVLDPRSALLDRVEEVTYSLPAGELPESREGYERRALEQQASGKEKLYVHARIRLKDGRELILLHNLISSQSLSKRSLIRAARLALNGADRRSDELKTLYKQLESVDQFDYASELLLLKIIKDQEEGKPTPLRDFQTLAKYIYKDDSLPSLFKFDRALQELEAKCGLAGSDNCETIGLAGAIYKRKWQFDHQHKNLVLSRYYYEKGFGLWKEYLGKGSDPKAEHQHNDSGWNAINYAYVLELEVVNDLEETGTATGYKLFGAASLAEAQGVRKYILQQFLKDPFTKPELLSDDYPPWVLATIAEAYFGLCRYKEALEFIGRYRDTLQSKPWELRTFSQQMFSIAYLQQARLQHPDELANAIKSTKLEEEGSINTTQIIRCLNALDIKGEAHLERGNVGKTGLALSGGGFRASLFHIGVLAALAERDELKNVEVISCVSGGSIIGAYYYLKLKLLLEEKEDEDITREDYIRLVKETEEGFLKGVQENLRMHIFSSLSSNLKMLSKDYSRTNRLGELYEKHLYKPIFEEYIRKQEERTNTENGELTVSRYKELTGPDARPIYMDDLFINPDDDFVFATDNWKRKNKVPQLILNATCVNTGHNWQFTASWMGEPAAGIIAGIDVKSRLRRMYYNDAPEKYQRFRLGYAVGASSCVPVMFEPLPMNDLYPEMDMQLIDGGLHDNQGVASIIDQECKNVIISDASGQLPTNNTGVSGLLALFMRADNILQERLRELQFLDMKERRSTALVNTLHHVHLKNGITTPSINWVNCTDPPRTISHADPNVKDKNLMPYGILRPTQYLISQIRTDLDAFHDIEAYALMYDGYAQMHNELGRSSGTPDRVPDGGEWDFLRIEDSLKDPKLAEKIDDKLAISSRVPFKLYHLVVTKPVKIVLWDPLESTCRHASLSIL